MEQLSDGAGESIPMACQDWANTKAAYRFFGNERVNERDILAGHFQSTRQRFLDSGSNELQDFPLWTHPISSYWTHLAWVTGGGRQDR